MRTLMSFAGLLLLASACAEPFSNDDLRFLKALPTREQLALTVPGAGTSTSALTAGAPTARGLSGNVRLAEYYQSARATSAQLNGVVFFILDLVEAVEAYPPTTREADTRTWGPFPGKPGDPNQYLMTVKRTHTSTIVRATSTSTQAEVSEYYDYALVGVAPGSSMWLPLFGGRYAPSPVMAEGMGTILVNFEAIRALNHDPNSRGYDYIAYDNRFAQQTIEIALDLVVDPAHPFATVDAGYRFHAEASGDKSFLFAMKQNIPDIRPDTMLETYIISARWLPSEAGRANVVVKDGDLGAEEYYEVECWSPAFEETFFTSNIPGAMPYGAITDCAPELQSWTGG